MNLFGDIRPEDSPVTTEKQRQSSKAQYAQIKAMKLATGKKDPRDTLTDNPQNRHTKGRPKSIVNKVTEYGALFNKLNDERLEKGLSPLRTAMDVLIEAMNSDELDLKEKAKIAEKLATFESSRAPIISIEHVQNISKEEEVTADEALDDFLQAIRKV
jgi:hypothetical protein